MRNLAIRLVLWLCARFDIVLIDEARRFAPPDAIARGQRWEAFYAEEGGIADMITQARREAFEAYSDCRPADVSEREYLAMSDRCWRQLDRRVRSVIETGQITAKQNAYKGAVIGMPRKSV
jgi:hypothetical protein